MPSGKGVIDCWSVPIPTQLSPLLAIRLSVAFGNSEVQAQVVSISYHPFAAKAAQETTQGAERTISNIY